MPLCPSYIALKVQIFDPRWYIQLEAVRYPISVLRIESIDVLHHTYVLMQVYNAV